MNKVNNTLQQLIFGDRNIFIFENFEDNKPKISPSKIVKFLTNLESDGYAISNPDIFFSYTKANFKQFKQEFFNLIDSNLKDGFIFRKTFADTEDLSEYSTEDWRAILAQYSITYGWSTHYENEFNISAETILNEYVGSLDLTTINKLNNTKVKTFSVGGIIDLGKIIINILESKTVLRTQQIKVLENTPKYILIIAAKNSKITIKETLVKVMKLLQGEKLDFPLLKTATDVLRFVVSSYAHTSVEGQINKTILKETKIRIPTSIRKMLLNNLEMIANKKAFIKKGSLVASLEISNQLTGSRFLTEDMFLYQDFWMILDKYLRYEKLSKMIKKYPLYVKAIDLLYENDRSWTFNGRYSAAKERLDYEDAILVAKERPGFLLRNIIEFIRMKKGARLPVKKGTKLTVNNAFQNALTGDNVKDESRIIKTSGIEFLLSDNFENLINKSLNTKLAWQLVEQLKNKDLFEDVYKRTVQGKEIEYTTPIPAIDKSIAKKIRKIIIKSIKKKLQDNNKDIGKIYIDKDSYGYKLQYSGRDSTEISYAGEFLSPGTELNLLDLIKNKGIENPLLRLGVMWRGQKSTDLDHSLTLNNGKVIYYSSPVLTNSFGKILVTSSADITSCAGINGKFSTELIDIDLLECKIVDIKEMFNSFINYSGSTTIGELECYIFFSIIDKSKRIIKGNRVFLDLAKQDYAIRIDPDNTDKTGSYIGCSIDLVNNVIKVLSIPVKGANGHFSNARTNYTQFKEAIKNAKVDGLNIGYALNKVFEKEQFVSGIIGADLVISRKSKEELGIEDENVIVLHPGRDSEDINKFLFQN